MGEHHVCLSLEEVGGCAALALASRRRHASNQEGEGVRGGKAHTTRRRTGTQACVEAVSALVAGLGCACRVARRRREGGWLGFPGRPPLLHTTAHFKLLLWSGRACA